MKSRLLMVVMIGSLFIIGSAFAQMGGGNMGPGGGHMMPGPGPMPGPRPGPGPGPNPGPGGHMGGGMGSGMMGAGSMVSNMMSNTISDGFLDVLSPLTSADQARLAIEAFITSSNSSLQISELWEYGTVYKAELSDTTGAMAFDLVADKFTGVVMPEMGMSMMLNASYGKGMYKTSAFGRKLTVTPAQATDNAQTFINNNGLGYTLLGSAEAYPGYYKFHTTSGGAFGPDIMVDGYNGQIWMNTLYGLPIAQIHLP
jgi:hypothetical protein